MDPKLMHANYWLWLKPNYPSDFIISRKFRLNEKNNNDKK